LDLKFKENEITILLNDKQKSISFYCSFDHKLVTLNETS